MLSLKHLKLGLSIGLLIALIVAAGSDPQQTSLLFRGDFPAFYGAGRIALGETPGGLYSSELQASVQTGAWPSLGQEFYYFAYPPWVALAVAPLALFDPIFAKLLWTALQLLALWFACAIVPKSASPDRASGLGLSSSDWFFLAVAAAPVFFGVLSGQNVALSMLCYSLLCAEGKPSFGNSTARDGRPGSMLVGPVFAGIGLGIWMFKPHFAAVAFLYLALAGRKQVLLWSYLPIAFYLLGTQLLFSPTVLDFGWLRSWAAGLAEFADRDYAANAHQMISFLGAANSLKAAFGITQFSLMQGVAWLLAAGVFACTGWHFVKARRSIDTRAYQHALALLGPTIALITPHALFYDAGLCLISIALIPLAPKATRPATSNDSFAAAAIALAALVLLGVMRGMHESLPLDPLGPAIFGLYLWLVRTDRFEREMLFEPSARETGEVVMPDRS